MKRIALIMDGWKRFFTYAWPAGILQRLRQTGEEVNLYIFNSSGDWSRDKDYNIGEYNIYRLPDLNDFDGIVLDVNNIQYAQIRDDLVAAAKKTDKPVIAIANEIEDFYYVGINNYHAIREIIAHMHEKHACRKFWFIMGPEDNYENSVRVCALKDYMSEHQILYEEADFYFDSFEYQCGYAGFEKMCIRHGDQIPDCVICANDNIAVGVCEAALKRGWKVPDDFCVSGFDNFDKASYYSPKITTVGHSREEVGYLCADILLRLWDGQQVPRFNYTGTNCIFWESCGCKADIRIDHAAHAKDRIMYGIETADFEEQMLVLEYELLQCKTVQEMTKWMPACIPAMKCDAMYMIADEHLNDYKKRTDYYDLNLPENEQLHIIGYPETMKIEFAYVDGKIQNTDGRYIRTLFPFFDHDTGGADFLFLPLHFRERTVGYFVIRNAVYLMEKQYLFQIINTLTSAMENLHKKEKLAYLNQMLCRLYVRDAMTGMYNYTGYQQMGGKLFERNKRRKENLLILFVDMDRLKYINDHFGHERGDEAICMIAKAIQQNCLEDSVPVRTGGDEFLIIQQAVGEDCGEGLIASIRKEIAKKAEDARLPYPLTVSIGCVRTDMCTDKTLDDYVREADQIMYAEKLAKKVNRE